MDSITIDEIDALLPQTQCRQCGFAGCRPYAEALITHRAPVDQCKPGGTAVIKVLQEHLNHPASLSPSLPPAQPAPQVAYIDESQCIGCALCLAVCPVDAIVGTSQFMHTVIEADCTGCALCVAPCPVECIHIKDHPHPDPVSGYSVPPAKAREAFLRQQARRTPEQHQKAERLLALYHPVQTIAVQTAPEVPHEERLALIHTLRSRAKKRREQE